MFKTQLVPIIKNGMFVGYKHGTREDCTRAQIDCLENEYHEHEARMKAIELEINALKEELDANSTATKSAEAESK